MNLVLLIGTVVFLILLTRSTLSDLRAGEFSWATAAYALAGMLLFLLGVQP